MYKTFQMHLYRWIILATVFAIFFPFASIYPIHTDVQPVAFILCLLLIFFGKISLYKEDLKIILSLILFSFFFISYINFDSPFLINKRFAFFCGTLIFIFLVNYLEKINIKILILMLIIHVGLIIYQYIFPDDFIKFFGVFIRETTYFEGDIRGVHGLNAEPGGASAVIAGLYFIINFKFNKIVSNNFLKFFIFATSLLGLILTQSGLGIVIIIFITFHYLITIDNFYIKFIISLIFFIFIATILFLFTIIFENINSRSINLLIESYNNFPDFIFSDGSIAERLLGLSYGLYSLINFPLGVGGGGYSFSAQYVENQIGLSSIFYSARDQISDTTSTVGIYLAEFGIFFILFLFFILYLKPKSFNLYIAYIIAIGFLFFSFSASFPITWAIFSVCYLDSKSK